MNGKSPRLTFALAAAVATLHGAWATDSSSVPEAPKVEVAVESELRMLARGFVAAFAEMPVGSKWVWIRSGSETFVLGSVASIKAYEGVLAIRLESGPTHLISAAAILQITNERPK